MRSLPGRLPSAGTGRLDIGRPILNRLERTDLAWLAGLVAIGLVPFAGVALGAHWSVARLLLGAAVVLVSGGQLVVALRRSPAGGEPDGLRVPRPRPVLLRGDLGPGAAPRPPVMGRR